MKTLIFFIIIMLPLNVLSLTRQEAWKIGNKIIKDKKQKCPKGFKNIKEKDAFLCENKKGEVGGYIVWQFNNGRLEGLVETKNNLKDGKEFYWHKNGKISIEKNKKKGKNHGKVIYWRKDGTKSEEHDWENDTWHGYVKKYNKKGKLISKKRWEHGSLADIPLKIKNLDKKQKLIDLTRVSKRCNETLDEVFEVMPKKRYSGIDFQKCLNFMSKTRMFAFNVSTSRRVAQSQKAGVYCALTKSKVHQLKNRCVKRGGRIMINRITKEEFCSDYKAVHKPNKALNTLNKQLKEGQKTFRDSDFSNISLILTSLSCGTKKFYKKTFKRNYGNRIPRRYNIFQMCGSCLQCIKAHEEVMEDLLEAQRQMYN